MTKKRPYKQFINGQVEPFLERAGETSVRFIRPASRSGRFIKAKDQASGRDGRFINQERRFGLRMADFILPRTSSLSAAKSSHV